MECDPYSGFSHFLRFGMNFLLWFSAVPIISRIIVMYVFSRVVLSSILDTPMWVALILIGRNVHILPVHTQSSELWVAYTCSGI